MKAKVRRHSKMLFYSFYITNKAEYFSGCVVRVAKHLKKTIL